MYRVLLIGFALISLSICANAQDVPRIFVEDSDDSTVVLRFGRYRITLRDGSDTLDITPRGLFFSSPYAGIESEADDISWQRRGTLRDLDSLNIDLPDTGLGIIIHNWIVRDTGGPPLDSVYCCWGDSLAKCTVVTHPSVLWADNGIFGDYCSQDTNFDTTSPRGIMVLTPYNLGTVCENPSILATHGKDSLGNFNWRSWGSDTTQNPIITPYELNLFCEDTSNKDPNGDDYSPYYWGGFSDVTCFPGHTGESLWVAWRAKGYDTSAAGNPEAEAIWIMGTDGSRETSGDDSGHLAWCDPTMILVDTGGNGEAMLSPFVLQLSSSTYRMWVTRKVADTANYMWMYETDSSPDAEYWDTLGRSYIVDNDTLRGAMSDTLLELWHPNALVWSPNVFIGLFSYGKWGSSGSYGELYLAESNDGGYTWRVRDSVFLPYDTSGVGWFDDIIYRAAAWWNIYGNEVTMDVFFAGDHTSSSGNWDIGHAETYWTPEIDTIENAHNAVTADTATTALGISAYENIDVVGDLGVHGNIVHWNWASEVDINKAWTIRPETYITAPTFPGCEYAGKDYDDSCAICHIGDVYSPNGYSYNSTPYGWKRIRVGTPFAAGQPAFEDVCLYASNNGDHWVAYIEIDSITYPWPDSVFLAGPDTIFPTQYTWAYADASYYDSTNLAVVWGDTVNNPIFTEDTFGAVHLSDCDLEFGADGELLIIFRETRTVDTCYLRIAWTQDPTSWTTDSCNVIMGGFSDVIMGLSPSLRLDTNGTYEMWFVEGQPTSWVDTVLSDTNYVLVKWESDDYRDSSEWAPANTPWEAYYIDTSEVPDDTIYTVTGVCLVQNPDSSKYQMWHPEIISLGVDDYLMINVWAFLDAHDTTDVGLLQSHDGGVTWASADSILLRPTMETPDLQGYQLYRGSGFPLWDGEQWCIDWTVPGQQSGASAGDAIWHLFHGRIYFNKTDTADPVLVAYSEALIEDSLDEYLLTTGQAADVDTAGTDIAAALADRANIHDTLDYTFNLANPDALYAEDHEWCIDPRTKDAITITRIDVSLDADPTTELPFSLKFADALIGFANATVIDDTATVAGVTTVTAGFGDATVPANKCIYWLFDADPDDAITQVSVKISYTVD